MDRIRFKFVPYGNHMTEPNDKMRRIDFVPMNCRYMSDPVTIGDVEVVVEVTAYEYDEKARFDIYETDGEGLCTGNIKRMEDAGLLEPYEYGYKIKDKPYYRPADIAEALQRLYPEVEAECYFEDIDRLVYYDRNEIIKEKKKLAEVEEEFDI